MFTSGFLLFPNVTQLDLMGPLQVLYRLPGSTCHVAAASMDPVPTDCGVAITPTTTFDDCPQLDLLCVPGGYGTADALSDPATMTFVRNQAKGATYLTSVCTGAFVLGAAGLLKGKKATTHWAYHDALKLVGAKPTKGRVVRDGNVITGGGVTAGIDFALTVASEIAGPAVAQGIQLALEYAPAPPFGAEAGDPEHAAPPIRDTLSDRFGTRREVFEAKVRQAFTAG